MKQMLNATLLAGVLMICACHTASEKNRNALNDHSGTVTTLNREIGNGEQRKEEKTDSIGNPPYQVTAPAKQPGKLSSQPEPPEDYDRKIIRIADLGIEVPAYDSFNRSFRQQIAMLGGYVASEQQTRTDYRIENVTSIRIPVDRFTAAMELLEASPGKVFQKTVSSQDVSTEIVDAKTRIENKRHTRDRYLELLKQSKNMEDILSVQKEIDEIQQEMEGSMGRREFLSHAAAYSTINLTYFQVLDAAANPTDKTTRPGPVFDALARGWTWFSALIVELLVIWPLLVIGLLTAFWYRHSHAKKTTTPVKSAEIKTVV